MSIKQCCAKFLLVSITFALQHITFCFYIPFLNVKFFHVTILEYKLKHVKTFAYQKMIGSWHGVTFIINNTFIRYLFQGIVLAVKIAVKLLKSRIKQVKTCIWCRDRGSHLVDRITIFHKSIGYLRAVNIVFFYEAIMPRIIKIVSYTEKM